MQMLIFARRFLAILCTAGLLTVAACDSGGNAPPDEVVGLYTFTELQFQPTSSALPTVNVLDTLATAQVEFFSDGSYALRYRFESGNVISVQGSFSRNGQEVPLSVEEGNEEFYRNILLPPNGFELQIVDGDRVNQLTADLETAYSGEALREFKPEAYEGISSVEGQTQITLERSF